MNILQRKFVLFTAVAVLATMPFLSTSAALTEVPNEPVDAGTTSIPPVPCADPLGCPDLITDPNTMAPYVKTQTFKEKNCAVVEGSTKAGTRTLLKFTFTTPNVGEGDLIVGNPEDHPEWFEYSECHGHYHFRQYADYRLWTPEGFSKWDALRKANPHMTPAEVLAANPTLSKALIVGLKQGFCIMDVVPYGVGVPKYPTCLYQGISVGWADEYYDGLDGQWIDITGVARGAYVLEAEVNAERLYEELDYTNNRASVPVTI